MAAQRSIIGENIKRFRVMREMTQAELGKRVNMSKGTINNYEHGTRTPDANTIHAISQALDIDPNTLYVDGRAIEDTINKAVGAIEDGRIRSWEEFDEAVQHPDRIQPAPYAGGIVSSVPAVRVVGNVQSNDDGSLRMGDYRGWATADVNDPTKYFYWQCTRDAMTPNVQPGDLLLIHIQDECDDGDMVVVTRQGMGGRLCRVRRREDGGLTMLFDSPNYPPIEAGKAEKPAIAGKVKRLVRVFE